MRAAVLRFSSCLLALGLSLGASVAHAQAVDDAGGVDYPAPEPTQRGGVMIGLGLGYGYGHVEGYRNKLTEIGNPEFRQNVGGLGSNTSIWIGGALRDWVTFGVGVTSSGATKGDIIGGVGSVGVRLEGFPLFALGGLGHDLGFVGEFGAGGGAVISQENKRDPLADGGSMSFLGFGAFWEVLKVWHWVIGPSIHYTHAFSSSLRGNIVTVGLRTALYWTRPRTPKVADAGSGAYTLEF
jgi:hypothetical protein